MVILSRRPEAVEGLPAGARATRWDGKTADGWSDLAEGARAIVHLAGESIGGGRWTRERKRRIRTSRVRSGEAVAEAIARARAKPEVLLQASAVGYYGPGGSDELTAWAPPGDDFLARTCVAWEGSTERVEAMGVRRPVLRTGVVLSAAGGALAKMLPVFRLGLGGPLGSGAQYFPWIHIADEAAAIRFLMEDDHASGPYNLTAPDPVTNREFTRALGRALHRPAILKAPAAALRLLLGEMASVLLDGQRAVPRRLQERHFSFRFTAIEPALRDLLG